MPSRRRFLKNFSSATAGIVAGGGLAGSAFGWPQAQAPASASRGEHKEIRVGGRRARVIDTWNHINVPEIWSIIPPNHPLPLQMEAASKKIRSQPIPQFDPHGPEIEKLLSQMDTMGIDMGVVCVGSLYWAEQSLSRELTQVQNEKIAQLCAVYPDRFRGFGTISLQYPDLAVKEMEDGVKKLKMVGFTVGGSVNGKELSAREFDPVWAKAEQLGTVIFLRGALNGVGDQTKPYPDPRFQGHGWLASVVGGPLELTLALSHLIEEGTLDRFPDLKILSSGGGYIIETDAMADKCGPYFPDLCQQVKKHPKEYYLKRLYYDSMHRTTEGLRHLIATVGVSQVVLGTDNAQPWNSEGVDRVLAVPGLSNADRIAILGGNAAKLLGLGS